MTSNAATTSTASSCLKVALIHDAFFGEGAEARLLARLREARAGGATLAVLSELPLNHWMAVDQMFSAENAERLAEDAADNGGGDNDGGDNGGERQACLRRCARAAGIAVVGGAITYGADAAGATPPVDVTRCESTCWLLDERGERQLRYAKVHLPQEPGYWEASHYAPSTNLPQVADFGPIDDDGRRPWRVGVQLCSDVMRPAGAALLAEQGVQLLVHPRATPLPSYAPLWRPVLRAAAITSAAYVISVNRPEPAAGHGDGAPCSSSSPSLVVSPGGEVVCETTDPVTVVMLDMAAVDAAKAGYPGYLRHAEQLQPAAAKSRPDHGGAVD